MRITGGTHRSRLLKAPPGRKTRPTTDRVREAMFGILTAADAVRDARVLDLYAGTGALGLEALSRGAARATFVESSRSALAALRANVAALDFEDRAEVLPMEVSRAIPRVAGAGCFTLVLADPPYDRVEAGSAARELEQLACSEVAVAGALVVLEQSSRTRSLAIDGLIFQEARHYGDTTLAFYKTAILGTPRSRVGAGPPFE
jgi:16S rRNA (guanine966-N2)-methyltransferase